MDWSPERCVRSSKRRRSNEHLSDHLSKVSRLSFPSLLSATHLLNHDAQRATDCDLSDVTLHSNAIQLKLQSDTYNGVYTQPDVISRLEYSHFDSPHLNPKICDVTVSEIEQGSLTKYENSEDSSIKDHASKESSDNIYISRTFSSKQVFHSNSHIVSSDRGCPDCAAGQSGHIRHIGRWRLMDSV